jgi:hypothetical protein
MSDPSATARRPPAAALLLGYGGVLPPVIAILVRLAEGGGRATPLSGMLLLGALIYAGLILSFLGGVWWGVAAARLPAGRLGPWLTTAVMPSLIALPAIVAAGFAPRTGAALLGVALVATLLGDRRLAQAGLVPGWWMALRVPLSCALAAATMMVGMLV